ncbi:MAG: MiaB/RimO family radical SAM methylthiotransferase, partial [Desulfobacterales bacterium]
PQVRGREARRPPDRILDEIRRLVAEGVREVTLLGQNVNSYGSKEGLCSFPELLGRVNEIEGLARIRFTTSHPKDLSEELIGCFATLDKLCRHIHLPVQSGSDAILKRMNRRYTRDAYLQKVDRLRAVCPEIGITSDFIVGFPGETDEDFSRTLGLMQAVGFDGVFAFQYSDRPSAPASRFGRKVSEPVKKRRLAELLALQEKTTLEKNRALIGRLQQVMVEGPSKKDYSGDLRRTALWMGRTSQNRIVHFPAHGQGNSGRPPLSGEIVDIRIDQAFSHSLRGTLITERPEQCGRKGVDSHAA